MKIINSKTRDIICEMHHGDKLVTRNLKKGSEITDIFLESKNLPLLKIKSEPTVCDANEFISVINDSFGKFNLLAIELEFPHV